MDIAINWPLFFFITTLLLPYSVDINAETGQPNEQKTLKILRNSIEPGEISVLEWTSGQSFSGRPVKSPVTVVHGSGPGPTLCLVAAIHGDELNGVEIVRRIGESLDPATTQGTVITVPIVNVYGLTSNSRYLPDRRDLNRFFPGNPTGSAASRIAYSFFTKVISYCDYLVDFHTGSFKRSNLPQLRSDMNNPAVAQFVQHFGSIVVLHKAGHSKTLRSAATTYGIPTVTFELGQPGSIQEEHVEYGLKTINYLMASLGIVDSNKPELDPQPVYFNSRWVRANSGGILFSKRELGEEVKTGDLLGTIINPITNIQIDLLSPVAGRVLGMALNQFMLPGYAAFHIGISTNTESMIENEQVGTDEYSEHQEEFD